MVAVEPEERMRKGIRRELLLLPLLLMLLWGRREGAFEERLALRGWYEGEGIAVDGVDAVDIVSPRCRVEHGVSVSLAPDSSLGRSPRLLFCEGQESGESLMTLARRLADGVTSLTAGKRLYVALHRCSGFSSS